MTVPATTAQRSSPWNRRGAFAALLSLLLVGSWLIGRAPHAPVGVEPVPPETKLDDIKGATPFDEQVRPFLTQHCQHCHGAEKPKGDFRVDRLTPDFSNAGNREQWQALLRRVKAGEMPPKEKPRPSEKEILAVEAWMKSRGDAAVAKRAAEGRGVLRRLNRTEYENTIRDLLGIEVDLKELLPDDTSAHGFDNIGDALHVSSFLMERYLEAADLALNLAIANGPQPPTIKKRYSVKDERQIKFATERVYLERTDGMVLFSSSPWNAVTLSQFYPPNRGKYRFRISAYGMQSAGKPVTFRLEAGPMLMGTKNHLVDYFDATADKATVIEFDDYLEARSTIRLQPYGLSNAQTVDKIGADKYEGPGLAVQWVEVEGPLYEAWPPESHRRLLGDLPQGPAPVFNNRSRVEVVSKTAEADAEKILRRFLPRAFRRPIIDADVTPFLALVKAKLAEKQSFEQAVRVGLKAILVAPDFLFLREKPGLLDEYQLASRLSYFLWSTMPDEELFQQAGAKKLRQPDVLRQQVERMLKSPRAGAFTTNFVGQWLGLRDIDFTSPDVRLYPEFDDMLKAAMVKETHLFFDELLRHDLSITNFVAADFTMLNERLANHYGITGVTGHQFRKVTLPPDSHRGGVLTMASVLKVTANGTNTSPVTRGAWVLDRILGTPPAPPPSGVPAVEPDIRGATTMRDQLAKHRADPACASCHRQIDPPGFALESFDVIGGWRDNYRSVGRGEAVQQGGKRMPYLKGPRVDPGDVLPDGRKFRNIDDYKQLLLKDQDRLARALAEKLLTYATGAPVETGDDAALKGVVDRIRAKKYGLRALVHEIVQSKPFQEK